MKVRFYVLFDNEPARVSAKLSDNLVEVFETLRKYPAISGSIPANAASSDYLFYQLKNPVLCAKPEPEDSGVFLQQVRQECKEAANRMNVQAATTTVRILAPQLYEDLAYLVIESHDGRRYILRFY